MIVRFSSKIPDHSKIDQKALIFSVESCAILGNNAGREGTDLKASIQSTTDFEHHAKNSGLSIFE